MSRLARRSAFAAIVAFGIVGCQATPPAKPAETAPPPPVALTWTPPSWVRTVPVNGYPMAYWERGSGEPIVFVPGASADLRTWYLQINPPANSQVAPLSREFRTIAVSPRRYWPEPGKGVHSDFSSAQHARDLVQFIEQLGRPVHLVGHSRGGRVALEAARARPDLIRKLVLAEPSVLLDTQPAAASREFIASLEHRASVVEQRFGSGDIEGGISYFFDYNLGEGGWAKAPDLVKQNWRDNAWPVAASSREPYPILPCESLKPLRVPTLLVVGENTRPLWAQASDALTHCLPDAEHVVIPGAGHAMYFNNPSAFNAAVTQFLKK